jgi:predicted small metal-binding protein
MRAFDCPCGEHFEAESDEALLPLVQQHIARDHPDTQMDDAQMRKLVSDRSHEMAQP